MYKLIVEEHDGRRGILILNDKTIYCGKIIKDSRNNDKISEEEVKEHNKKLLPWYKRIFA